MLNNAKVDGYELKLTNTDMKKYLFIALALLGMASCAKDDVTGGNKPHHNGEVEESYIAINLMAADSGTRGTSGTNNNDYEEGTDAERAVKTAYFFFFDAVGEPFYVNTTNTPATQPGASNQTNHLKLSISEASTEAMPNVSDIKEAVLILETYKGVYPSQIVAVINWVPTEDAYSLEDLHDVLAGLRGTDNGFVMSNSVYMDGAGKMVDAVPLTAANIKTSADAAKATPVEIYVERVAAKVVLTASGKVEGTTNIFDTQKNSSPLDNNSATTSEIDVYVQLHGWELYNDHNSSNLLKDIDPAWGNGDGLGLNWNDRFKFRSYWALSQDKSVLNDKFAWQYTSEKQTENGFKTEYGFAVASDATYTDETTYTYCGENTGVSTVSIIEGKTVITPYAKNTKVILKGQLMQKDGDTYKALELARWYGTDYAGEEALRIAVANSLQYTLFSSQDGINFDPIKPADLICVDGNVVDAEAYEVGFQLSSTDDFGEDKTWYKYDSTQGYVKFGNPDTYADNAVKTNEYLKTVQPALLYKTGQTYYIVDIEHFGTQTAAYGVVRNHVYQIDINSIKGYGSPVYTGTGNIVTPEYPEVEGESSYVAARINVLSWKVVKQGVNIVQ